MYLVLVIKLTESLVSVCISPNSTSLLISDDLGWFCSFSPLSLLLFYNSNVVLSNFTEDPGDFHCLVMFSHDSLVISTLLAA